MDCRQNEPSQAGRTRSVPEGPGVRPASVPPLSPLGRCGRGTPGPARTCPCSTKASLEELGQGQGEAKAPDVTLPRTAQSKPAR
ncbi:hypothetical protein NDU88_004298 [Pleurodeles waltl]|uniref:Uncharacterized protein n=1 Tax=Pleurodeles waltl TaxID=8319 RepID=A0AAV7T8R1_PLEWA|nr:hypothetical protein NDU88_004298 [Pleurodeles waltl]